MGNMETFPELANMILFMGDYFCAHRLPALRKVQKKVPDGMTIALLSHNTKG